VLITDRSRSRPSENPERTCDGGFAIEELKGSAATVCVVIRDLTLQGSAWVVGKSGARLTGRITSKFIPGFG